MRRNGPGDVEEARWFAGKPADALEGAGTTTEVMST